MIGMARTISAKVSGAARMGTSQSAPAGAQGTLGGTAHQPAGHPVGTGGQVLGVEVYLWILVLLEVGAIAFLRNHFSRYHGG